MLTVGEVEELMASLAPCPLLAFTVVVQVWPAGHGELAVKVLPTVAELGELSVSVIVTLTVNVPAAA